MTLTDVISKRNVYGTNFYGKKVIVNDNTANEAVLVEKSGSADAVRITNTGTGNSVVIEDRANPDSTPVIVNEDGNVAIGATNALYSAPLQVYSTNQNSSITLARTSNNDTGVRSYYLKYRGSVGSEAIVQDGDELFELHAQGSIGNGNAVQTAAKIEVFVDGTPSSGSIPGEIRLQTTSAGNSTPTSRVTIRSNGNVGIGTTTPSNTLHLDGSLRLDVTTGTSVGPAGTASPLPGAPEGWMVVNINGTSRRIPYWEAP